MSYQAKSKLANIVVYLVLALIVAAIVGAAIITFTSANKPISPVATPTTSTPPESTHPKTDTAAKTLHPTQTAITTPASTDLTPDSTKTKVPANNDETASFSNPAQGRVMKEHSVDFPVYSLTMSDYRTHSGIDISAAEGSSVCAIGSGTVSKIYNDVLMGKTVEIDHGGNLISVYSNLSDELAQGIAVGVKVGERQIIGAVGSTAILELAESDHLHFELRINGKSADPLNYLDYANAPLTDIPGNE